MDFLEALKRLEEFRKQKKLKAQQEGRAELYGNALPGTVEDPNAGTSFGKGLKDELYGLGNAAIDFGTATAGNILDMPRQLGDIGMSVGSRLQSMSPLETRSPSRIKEDAVQDLSNFDSNYLGGAFEKIKGFQERENAELRSHQVGSELSDNDFIGGLQVAPAVIADTVSMLLGPSELSGVVRGAIGAGKLATGAKRIIPGYDLIAKVAKDIKSPTEGIGRFDAFGAKTKAVKAIDAAKAEKAAIAAQVESIRAEEEALHARTLQDAESLSAAKALEEVELMKKSAQRRKAEQLFNLESTVQQEQEAAERMKLMDPAYLAQEIEAIRNGKDFPTNIDLFDLVDQHHPQYSAQLDAIVKGRMPVPQVDPYSLGLDGMPKLIDDANDIDIFSVPEVSDFSRRYKAVSEQPEIYGRNLFEEVESAYLDTDGGVLMEVEPKLIRSASDLVQEQTGKLASGAAGKAQAASGKARNAALMSDLSEQGLAEIPGKPFNMAQLAPTDTVPPLNFDTVPMSEIATDIVYGAQNQAVREVESAIANAADRKTNSFAESMANFLVTGSDPKEAKALSQAAAADNANRATAMQTIGNAKRTAWEILERSEAPETIGQAKGIIKGIRAKTDEVIKGLGHENTIGQKGSNPAQVYDPEQVHSMYARYEKIIEEAQRKAVSKANKAYGKLVKANAIPEGVDAGKYLEAMHRTIQEEAEASIGVLSKESKTLTTDKIAEKLRKMGDDMLKKHKIDPIAFKAACL